MKMISLELNLALMFQSAIYNSLVRAFMFLLSTNLWFGMTYWTAWWFRRFLPKFIQSSDCGMKPPDAELPRCTGCSTAQVVRWKILWADCPAVARRPKARLFDLFGIWITMNTYKYFFFGGWMNIHLPAVLMLMFSVHQGGLADSQTG